MKSILPLLLFVFALVSCREAAFKSILDQEKSLLDSANADGQGAGNVEPYTGSAGDNGSGLPGTQGNPDDPVDIPPGGSSDSSSSILTVNLDKSSLNAGGEKARASSVLKDGTQNPPVIWTAAAPSGKAAGTIDANGVYTSPTKVDTSYTVTIRAVLQSDPTVTGYSTLTVLPLPKLELLVTVPVAALPMGGAQTQATAALSDGTQNPPVKWTVSAPGSNDPGTISSSGIYTSPAQGNDPYRIVITATLIADETIKASVPLDLKPSTTKPHLIVTLPVTALNIGSQKTKATASLDNGTLNPPVTWTLWAPANKDPGSIDSDGNYTSPASGQVQYAVNIIATLKADPSVIGYTPLILLPSKVELAVILPSSEIKAGGKQLQAKAKLKDGTENPPVRWSVIAPPNKDPGSINANGLYTSPATSTEKYTIAVVATLIADPSIQAYEPLTILQDDQVFVRCKRGNMVFPILADVYSLPHNTKSLPKDFSKLNKATTVCMDKYDVPNREFCEGFPGVPGLFEWFALSTKTTLIVPKAGYYTFRMNSDDGSKLWISNQLIIDNDGLHSQSRKESTVYFSSAGKYDMVLNYFQGPRYNIALELFWKKPGDTGFTIIPTGSFQ